MYRDFLNIKHYPIELNVFLSPGKKHSGLCIVAPYLWTFINPYIYYQSHIHMKIYDGGNSQKIWGRNSSVLR